MDAYERGNRHYYPNLKDEEIQYRWSEASKAAKKRLDFVVRASEVTQRQPIPAMLFVRGEQGIIYSDRSVLSKSESIGAFMFTNL